MVEDKVHVKESTINFFSFSSFLVKVVVELMASGDSSFLAAACWRGFTTATRRRTSAGRRSFPGRRKRPSFLELSTVRGGHFVDMVPNIIVPSDALPPVAS